MALSDDQRALLRLLAQREEGYEDIAALMGLSVDEVRRRVRGALKELDEGGAAAGPVGAGDPPPPPVAEASSGVVPPAPPPAEERPAPTPVSRPARARSRGLAWRQMSRRRRFDFIGGALVLVVLVLFLTGAVDLGGDSDSGGGDGGEVAAQNAGGGSRITQAVLEPVDGGDAAGRALFGRVKEGPVLQVQAEGLDPSPKGQSYAIWLFRSPKVALRVGAVRVGKSGGIATQLPMPLDLLGFVANGSFNQVRISLVGDSDYAAEVARAKRQKDLPPYSGESVLEGDIVGPGIEAAGSGGN